MRFIITTIIIFSLSLLSFSQDKYYSNPVKIPMLLSGSFAELRSNHFHSGIDIKTQGVTGHSIYAVADGYISRISVSPTGFGKAIYISHPNGTTSVYAHLQNFREDIAYYVKERQYEKKSYKINLHLPPYLFKVKQNDEIAHSGNSGSSGGPHLHFEIRDTKTEEPLNPLQFNFPVKDNISPKIFSLLVVPLSDTSQVNYQNQAQSFSVTLANGKYQLKDNKTIAAYGPVGFAIQTNDYFNDSYNKCGINFLSFDVDNNTQFAFQLNRFSFSKSRYINSHIYYPEYVDSKRRFIKTWIDNGNLLPIYTYNLSNGQFTPTNSEHNLEISISDTYKNISSLVFRVSQKHKEINANFDPYIELMSFKQRNIYSTNNFEINIPKGALYKDLKFRYSSNPTTDKFFSDFHDLTQNKVALHKGATIRIKPQNISDTLKEKVLVVDVNTKNGDPVAAGGVYKDGWVTTTMRNMGMYAITVDTIPPTIIPLSIRDGKLTESNRMRFKINDDLSGIKSIKGYIDGKWALFEYDAKRSRITHYFDSDRFDLNKNHNFKLLVTDYCGNSTEYQAKFWK